MEYRVVNVNVYHDLKLGIEIEFDLGNVIFGFDYNTKDNQNHSISDYAQTKVIYISE